MNKQVSAYINNLPDWQRGIMSRLRETVHLADSEIGEAIKWGSPAFEHEGLVCWMFAATEWVHFSFPQGVLLDHSHGLFEEGDDTEIKAKRTIKFHKKSKIPTKVLIHLIKQAVTNNITGKKIVFKPEPKKEIVLPEDLKMELLGHSLEKQYWARPYYQQKGYVQWLDGAKRPETREKRVKKIIEELETDLYMPSKKASQ